MIKGHKDEWYMSCDFLGENRKFLGIQILNSFSFNGNTNTKFIPGVAVTYIFVPTNLNEFIFVVEKVSFKLKMQLRRLHLAKCFDQPRFKFDESPRFFPLMRAPLA